MLGNGTRRIPVAKQEDDPYSIVVEFFRIGNSSLNVARAKADDVFARKGANRYELSAETRAALEDGNKEILSDQISSDASLPFVRQICSSISLMTSEFKRQCVVGFFMANGTTLRYPSDFKLRTDLPNIQRNLENDEINEMIDKFNAEQSEKLFSTINEFNDFIDKKLPKNVSEHYKNIYDGFFDPSNSTGNIDRDIKKQQSANPDFTDELAKEFKEIILRYREELNLFKKPGHPRVADFLGYDRRIYLRTAQDALGDLLSSLPNKLVTNIIDGEL